MDIWDEMLAKVFKGAGKPGDEATTGLHTIGESRTVKLERYYAQWRKLLEQAANNGQILSNGWAFSALGGVAAFENYVRTAEISSIYFNRSAEISSTLDAIADKLPGVKGVRRIGGIILYGYGNLFRESQFIEVAVAQKVLKSQRVYLLDCSLFYHIFAKSALNPLRAILGDRQINIRLIDYLEDPASLKTLTYIRDDLNPMLPVLHLFLGNTFCNIEATALSKLLSSVVRDNDFIIGEYANYPDAYFQNVDDDYVSRMAAISASELFSLPISRVISKNVLLSPIAKVVEVSVPTRDASPKITFRSMLRRKYHGSELTNGAYELVSQGSSMGGKVCIDTYRRLPL